MSDPRLDDIAQRAGSAARAPEFHTLAKRGRRRRQADVLAVGVAAALVVGVTVVGVRGVYGDQSAPTPPATQPAPTGTTPPSRAAGIVDDPSARLLSAAALPDAPDARAVVWFMPSNRLALAVTSDGFKTRSTVLLQSGFSARVTAAGSEWFFVGQPRGNELVSPDGVVRVVHAISTPSPFLPGEFLVENYSGETLAVDPVRAVTHPITLPQHSHVVVGGQGLIWTIAYTSTSKDVFHSAVDWSTDGGRTWSSHALAAGKLAVYTPVSSDPSIMAVSLTGDVTVTPLTKVVSSTDGGATWRTSVQPGPATPGVNWTVALPDGTFLADVLTWSDHPIGLLASVGTDWSHLVPVHPQLPPGEHEDVGALGELTATATSHGSFDLYASSGSQQGLLMSDDGGRTWAMTRVR